MFPGANRVRGGPAGLAATGSVDGLSKGDVTDGGIGNERETGVALPGVTPVSRSAGDGRA